MERMHGGGDAVRVPLSRFKRAACSTFRCCMQHGASRAAPAGAAACTAVRAACREAAWVTPCCCPPAGGHFFGTFPSGKRVQDTIFRGAAWPHFRAPLLELEAKWKGEVAPFGCAYTCAIGDTVTQGAAVQEQRMTVFACRQNPHRNPARKYTPDTPTRCASSRSSVCRWTSHSCTGVGVTPQAAGQCAVWWGAWQQRGMRAQSRPCSEGRCVRTGVDSGEGSYEYLVFNTTFLGVAARHGLAPLIDWGDPGLDACFDEASALPFYILRASSHIAAACSPPCISMCLMLKVLLPFGALLSPRSQSRSEGLSCMALLHPHSAP